MPEKFKIFIKKTFLTRKFHEWQTIIFMTKAIIIVQLIFLSFLSKYIEEKQNFQQKIVSYIWIFFFKETFDFFYFYKFLSLLKHLSKKYFSSKKIKYTDVYLYIFQTHKRAIRQKKNIFIYWYIYIIIFVYNPQFFFRSESGERTRNICVKTTWLWKWKILFPMEMTGTFK